MKKGDTIKCNGAEDTIQTMHDLATEGIETDFYYVDGEIVRTRSSGGEKQ